ncbi:MAG: porin [Marinosulfonomonas sp.]
MKRISAGVIASFLIAPLPGHAQELRTDEGTPAGLETEAWSSYEDFLNRTKFKSFYGQLSLGTLIYDDGVQTKGYPVLDNGNSGTRFGFVVSSTELLDDWRVSGHFEMSVATVSTSGANVISLNPDYGLDVFGLRIAELTFQSDSYGKIWVGQGAMASDGASGVDLSGTTIVASSSVADSAGGQLLRTTGGAVSNIAIGDSFAIDSGLSRKLRLRYGTPDLGGFDLRGSVGYDALNNDTTVLYDLAAVFGGSAGVGEAYSYRAAVAVSKPASSDALVNGSVSVLHEPTGLSLTGAMAAEYHTDRTGRYSFVKAGYQKQFFDVGATAFSVDAYFGSDIDAPGADSRSYALSVVQNYDRTKAEIYGTVRSYDYSNSSGSVGYRNGLAVFTGLRLKF